MQLVLKVALSSLLFNSHFKLSSKRAGLLLRQTYVTGMCYTDYLITQVLSLVPIIFPNPLPPPTLCLLINSSGCCSLDVSMCSHFSSPPMSENMQYFIFCSYVSLLRMMVSRFIHVPTKDTSSSFLIAA